MVATWSRDRRLVYGVDDTTTRSATILLVTLAVGAFSASPDGLALAAL